MEITRNDRVLMERAHVHAWPALRTANIDGWLWRSSGGGSQRANSVSTIDFSGNDLDRSIDTVEARYRALDTAALFQTFVETTPAGLTDALRARSYQDSVPTVTMFRANRPAAATDDVECRDHPWPEWLDVYLGAITESRRAVNTRILSKVPSPRAFLGFRRDGRIVSTALCVIGFDCAVVECVATASSARRQGGARAVMAGLLAWAARQPIRLTGLQVVQDNRPALRLYEDLGFVPGAANQFWIRP